MMSHVDSVSEWYKINRQICKFQGCHKIPFSKFPDISLISFTLFFQISPASSSNSKLLPFPISKKQGYFVSTALRFSLTILFQSRFSLTTFPWFSCQPSLFPNIPEFPWLSIDIIHSCQNRSHPISNIERGMWWTQLITFASQENAICHYYYYLFYFYSKGPFLSTTFCHEELISDFMMIYGFHEDSSFVMVTFSFAVIGVFCRHDSFFHDDFLKPVSPLSGLKLYILRRHNANFFTASSMHWEQIMFRGRVANNFLIKVLRTSNLICCIRRESVFTIRARFYGGRKINGRSYTFPARSIASFAAMASRQ